MITEQEINDKIVQLKGARTLAIQTEAKRQSLTDQRDGLYKKLVDMGYTAKNPQEMREQLNALAASVMEQIKGLIPDE